MFISLWNLTGTSAAVLPMCLSNFKAMAQFYIRGSETLRDLTIRRLIGYWNGALVLSAALVFLLWQQRGFERTNCIKYIEYILDMCVILPVRFFQIKVWQYVLCFTLFSYHPNTHDEMSCAERNYIDLNIPEYSDLSTRRVKVDRSGQGYIT